MLRAFLSVCRPVRFGAKQVRRTLQQPSNCPKRLPRWTRGERASEKLTLQNVKECVGYRSPLLSHRSVFGSDLLQLSSSVERLVRSNHSLVQESEFLTLWPPQAYGLMVLLVSKAVNVLIGPNQCHNCDIDEFGVLPIQRVLAGVTEMIFVAHLIHSGIVNTVTDETASDSQLGNKMAILEGDLLLARASKGLAQLHNTQVVGVISGSFADMMEGLILQGHLEGECSTCDYSHKCKGAFSVLLDYPEKAAPLTPCTTTVACDGEDEAHEWTVTYLQFGSLFATSCESAVLLADLPRRLQVKVFSMAQNIAMTLHSVRIGLQHESDSKVHQQHRETESVYMNQASQLIQVLPNGDAKLMLESWLHHFIFYEQ